jgi:hypothetical protein
MGFYELWGILRFQGDALEPVGDAIPEDEGLDKNFRRKMRSALQRIHEAGYGGDIAHRNYCRTKSGNVFLVDVRRCKLLVVTTPAP